VSTPGKLARLCTSAKQLETSVSIWLLVLAVFGGVILAFAYVAALWRFDYLSIVLVLLPVSTIASHALARLGPLSPLADRYWRVVDYPWILAAFGTLVFQVGRYYTDQAQQAAETAELLATQVGARLDARCMQVIHFAGRDSRVPKEAEKQILRDCVTTKLPLFGRDPKQIKALDETLNGLRDPSKYQESFDRVASLLVVPSFLRPRAPQLPDDRVGPCILLFAQAGAKRNDEGVRSLTEAYIARTYRNFSNEPFQEPGTDLRNWQPTPNALALDESFRLDRLLLCDNVLKLAFATTRLNREDLGWRILNFMSSHLPAWYLTLAVFAGLRLGKTAYETRAR
jgi:hypothetical protein